LALSIIRLPKVIKKPKKEKQEGCYNINSFLFSSSSSSSSTFCFLTHLTFGFTSAYLYPSSLVSSPKISIKVKYSACFLET